MRNNEARTAERQVIIETLMGGPITHDDLMTDLTIRVRREPMLSRLNKDPGAAANIIRQHATKGTNPLAKRLGKSDDRSQSAYVLNPDNPAVQEAAPPAALEKWRTAIKTADQVSADVRIMVSEPKDKQPAPEPPAFKRAEEVPKKESLETGHVKFVSLFCSLRDLLLALKAHPEIKWFEQEVFPFRLLDYLGRLILPGEKASRLMEQLRDDKVLRLAQTGPLRRGDEWNVYEVSRPDRYEKRYDSYREPNALTGQLLLERLLDGQPPIMTLEDFREIKEETAKRLPTVNNPIMGAETAPPIITVTEVSPPKSEVVVPTPAVEPAAKPATPTIHFNLATASDEALQEMQERLRKELALREQRAQLKNELATLPAKIVSAKTHLNDAMTAHEEAEKNLREAQKTFVDLERQKETLEKELARL